MRVGSELEVQLISNNIEPGRTLRAGMGTLMNTECQYGTRLTTLLGTGM